MKRVVGIASFMIVLAGSPGVPSLVGQEVPGAPDVIPTLRQSMDLPRTRGATISPDGRRVAFSQTAPNWETDGWTTRLLTSDGGSPVPIGHAEGFSGSYRWSPDSKWLAYVARGDGGTVLRLVLADGSGAAIDWPLPDGTRWFEFSPDGTRIALAVTDPESDEQARQRELFGRFQVKGRGFRMTHLWLADFDFPHLARTDATEPGEPHRLTSGDFTIGSFAWSPDGTRIAFDHAPDPRSNSSYASDVSLVELGSGAVHHLVTTPGRDAGPLWSPDGREILYSSSMGIAVSNLPMELVVIPATGGEGRVLTEEWATEPSPVAWIGNDIWFVADDGMPRGLYRLDTNTGAITQRTGLPEFVRSVSLSADGDRFAVLAESRATLREVYVGHTADGDPSRVTDATREVENWQLGTREVIDWQASDGLRIEGVLLKPGGFDPARQYPLLVVVHGGPRDLDRPSLFKGGPYPIERWVAQGALVLLPNYRGSAGYGPEFRTAHHRTAGFGDAMDVEAGVDHLIGLGMVDTTRVGVMGWSYGGFVSAWLSATSDRFGAISVGAGIADWRTHYAWESANITTRVFTFGTTPWEDPETWAASSPITHILGGRTPTLIQHVVGDPVVSILSAYELYQALTDLGVATELVEFPGSGHYPRSPKHQLALVWQNWEWFARYLWGEQADRDEVVGG